MPDLKQTITAAKGTFAFHLSRFFTRTGTRFFVSVKESTYVIHYFLMESHNSGWVIIFTPQTPVWLKQFESGLSNAINSQK